MTTATKTAGKGDAPRRKAPRKAAVVNGGNGAGGEVYEPPTMVRPPEEIEPVPLHPVYGTKKLYTYKPKDGLTARADARGEAPGEELIEFPHISTCRPTALFFYENRRVDEMHQAFAWMDLCGIPDHIGRRVFLLPDEEQGVLLREWFSGLNLTPAQGVSPPGES